MQFSSGDSSMCNGNWNNVKKMYKDQHSMDIMDGAKVIVCKLKNNPLGYTSIAYPVDELRIPQWFKDLSFDDEAMEVFVKKNDEELASRENFAVGGQNRWKYSTFLKWSFIPTKEFPIFMYFTESQTDPSKEGGQFHLFPVIMNGGQLYDQLVKRVGLK